MGRRTVISHWRGREEGLLHSDLCFLQKRTELRNRNWTFFYVCKSKTVRRSKNHGKANYKCNTCSLLEDLEFLCKNACSRTFDPPLFDPILEGANRSKIEIRNRKKNFPPFVPPSTSKYEAVKPPHSLYSESESAAKHFQPLDPPGRTPVGSALSFFRRCRPRRQARCSLTQL